MRYVESFARFWWNFIVGDDWRVAAGLAVALGLTYFFAHRELRRLVAAAGRRRALARRFAPARDALT